MEFEISKKLENDENLNMISVSKNVQVSREIMAYYPLAQQSCGGDIGSVPYVCM